MKTTAFQIETLKVPRGLFPVIFLGLVIYPKIDARIYALGVVAILWSYQEQFAKQDRISKLTRYFFRTLGILGLIAAIAQPF